jgi:hypothetical protein
LYDFGTAEPFRTGLLYRSETLLPNVQSRKLPLRSESARASVALAFQKLKPLQNILQHLFRGVRGLEICYERYVFSKTHHKVGAVFEYEKDKSGGQLFNNGVCRFTRTSFLYACPGVSPQRRRALVVANYAFIASVQARKLIRLVAPPLPKKSVDFSGTPNNAQSYPVRTAIQLSRIADGNNPPSSLDKGVPKNNLVVEKKFYFSFLP